MLCYIDLHVDDVPGQPAILLPSFVMLVLERQITHPSAVELNSSLDITWGFYSSYWDRYTSERGVVPNAHRGQGTIILSRGW